MSEPQNPYAHPEQDAPPTEAGDMELVAPPEGWPTVIGILGIIFGALGVLMTACGAVALVGMGAATSIVPEGAERDDLEAQLAQSMHHVPLQVGVQVIEFVISIVLIVGSVQLLKRSRASAGTLKIYSIADLTANTFGMIVGIMVAQAQAKAMAENPDATQQVGGNFMQAMGTAGAVFGWVLVAIWPVFLLIWFSRSKIKDSMSRW
jgi:hypothetical protein